MINAAGNPDSLDREHVAKLATISGRPLASVMGALLMALDGFPGAGLAQPLAPPPAFAPTFTATCPSGTYLTRIAWLEHASAVAGAMPVDLGTRVTDISCSAGDGGDKFVVPVSPPPPDGQAYARASQLDCDANPLAGLRQFIVGGRLEAFVAGCRTGGETLTPVTDFPEYAYLFQGEGDPGIMVIEPDAGTSRPSLCEGSAIGLSGSRRGALVTRLWLICAPVAPRGAADRATPQLPPGAATVEQPEPCPTFRPEPGAGRDPDSSIARQLDCPEKPNPRSVVAEPQPEPAPPPPPPNICQRRPDACRRPVRTLNIPTRPNEPADPPR
jgi:hypothetical protein